MNTQLSLNNIISNKSNNNIVLIFRYRKEDIPPIIRIECKPDEKIKEVI